MGNRINIGIASALGSTLLSLAGQASVYIPSPGDLGLSGSWDQQLVLALDSPLTATPLPSGTSPWAAVSFLDQGAADNSVWVAITTAGMSSSSEFLTTLAFNYAGNPTTLSRVGEKKGGTVTSPSLSLYSAPTQLAGFGAVVGTWDMALGFATAGGSGDDGRLQGGINWYAMKLQKASGTLSVDDFADVNNLDFAAAAHFQGLNGGSNKIYAELPISPVPEPSAWAVVAGLGLVGFAGYRRVLR